MGRQSSIRSFIAVMGGTVLARWLVFIICIIWLGACVGWSAGISGPPASAAFVRLAIFGPPVLCLLFSAALLNTQSISGSDAPSTTTAAEVARLRDIVIEIDSRISVSIERAESTLAALEESGGRADQAIADTRATLASLADLLRNIDDLSKETTSAVAKRAYALDAALEGVLERAERIFAGIDQSFRVRADEVVIGLKTTLSGLVGDVPKQVDHLMNRVEVARANGTSKSDARPIDVTAAPATRRPVASAITATQMLSRLLAPSAGGAPDCGQAAETATFNIEREGRDATASDTQEFIMKFEMLVGRALRISGGDDLAATLLNSEIGRLYQNAARRAGRIPS